jgi:hypothetical protein
MENIYYATRTSSYRNFSQDSIVIVDEKKLIWILLHIINVGERLKMVSGLVQTNNY